ncbi:hypothetical protein INT45_001966, partial [Circinella minor]
MLLSAVVMVFFVKATLFVVAQNNTILDALLNNGASTLHDIITNNPNHKSLVEYMTQPDASYTFFAPSDNAIQEAGLKNSQDNDYSDRFRYYIISNERLSQDEIHKEHRLRNSSFVPKQGKNHHTPLLIGTSPDGIWSYGEKGKIIQGDVQASNGVVHIIDHVLPVPGSAEHVLQAIPQTRDYANKLNSLNMSLQLFTHATVFAPTNDAIKRINELKQDLPTMALVLNHLVIDKSFDATSIKYSDKVVDNHGFGFNISHNAGTNSSINGIPVLMADQIFDDGLIHVTDGIVLRGGLDQPKADLPQPDTSNAMK